MILLVEEYDGTDFVMLLVSQGRNNLHQPCHRQTILLITFHVQVRSLTSDTWLDDVTLEYC